MRKKICYFSGMLILLVLFVFGLTSTRYKVGADNEPSKEMTFVVGPSDTTSDENTVYYSKLVDAIINASADYETVTTIELKSDISLSKGQASTEGSQSNESFSENQTSATDIQIKSGQNIIIKSQEPTSVTIGQEFLGYTVTLSGLNIILDRQSTLTLETNFVLTNNSSIKANEYNSDSNDFYAQLYVNDSLTLDGGTLNSTYFNTFEINGALNVSSENNNVITSNYGTYTSSSDNTFTPITPYSPIKLGSEAAVILLVGNSTNTIINGVIEGSFSTITYPDDTPNDENDNMEKTKKSIFVTNASSGYDNYFDSSVEKKYNFSLLSTTQSFPSEGNYILKTSSYSNSSYEIASNINISASNALNLFSFGDVKVKLVTSASIRVNGSLSIGGLEVYNSTNSKQSTIYTNGTNEIVLDGGSVWEEDVNGSYYFITEPYEPELNENVETYGRKMYSVENGSAGSQPIVYGYYESNINLFKGATLQNRLNHTSTFDDFENLDNIGGAIGLYGDKKSDSQNADEFGNDNVILNIFGATIQYNALTGINNSTGGAGIRASYATINMYDGNIIHNSVYETGIFNSTNKSADGAGISLVMQSKLNMYSGLIGYNHGSSAYDSDGAGVMVRSDSTLNIHGGDIAYNFTYGFGGGICVWNSHVTISGGNVYGNRATYGGGIATSANTEASITLNESTLGNTKIYNNTAYTPQTTGGRVTGYGGGLALGNSQFITNQTLTLNDADITNNTAEFGGGISVYSTGAIGNNKLVLNGGYIAENRARNNNQGNGIYCISDEVVYDEGVSYNGTNYMVELSGNIQIDTSNNIVFSGLVADDPTYSQIPLSNVEESNRNGWNFWENTNDNGITHNIGSLFYKVKNLNINGDYIELSNDSDKQDSLDIDNSYFILMPKQDCSIKLTFDDERQWYYPWETITYNEMAIYQSDDKEYSVNYGEPTNVTIVDASSDGTYKLTAGKIYSLVNTNGNRSARITKIEVDAPFTEKQIPIVVTNNLTATGIVGLISYADNDLYANNNILVGYFGDIEPQPNKFLLDTADYEVKYDESIYEKYLFIDSVAKNTEQDRDNDKFISLSYYEGGSIKKEEDNTYYSSLSEAIKSDEFILLQQEGKEIAVIIHKNRSLSIEDSNDTTEDATDVMEDTIVINDSVTIPSNSNVTIVSSDPSNICTLSLGENFAFGETLFTVEKDAELTLNNIIIDGNKERVVSGAKDGGNLIVENNGTFTLGENATIQNNRGTSDYASVIEIGRGNTVTNINGNIVSNEGYYGAIYSVYSTSIINIGSNAIITGTKYLGSDYDLDNYDLDVLLEGGTFNLQSFSGEIGVIGKIGSCIINATGTFSNSTPINVFVGDQQYYRNNTIVYSMKTSDTDQTLVAGEIDYTSHFTLILAHVPNYDMLKKSNTNYDTVLSMVLAIEISIQDIWENVTPSGSTTTIYEKTDNTQKIQVSDENFNSKLELEEYAIDLGLISDINNYMPAYHSATKTIIFYIDSITPLNLEKLKDLSVSNGFSIAGFILHASDAEKNDTADATKYYGLTSTISTKDYSDNESHIYLGVLYQANTYTITFDNGGLETVKGTMEMQEMSYEAFISTPADESETTNSPILSSTLNPLGYYATGFVFLGWKVKISTGYVQVNGEDLVLEDEADLASNSYIDTIKNSTESTSFTFEAQWASIFTGEEYSANYNSGLGTSSDPFIINDTNGLNMLARTINSSNSSIATENFEVEIEGKSYKYFNCLLASGDLGFEYIDYSNYYFKLSGDFDNSSDPMRQVIASVPKITQDVFGNDNLPIQSQTILSGAMPFSGNFDGNNKTITVDINGDDFIGLFGYTKDASIENVVIAGDVSGRISVGGLVGLSYGGTYYNIRNTANISFYGVNAGGIFGTYYRHYDTNTNTYQNGQITRVINEGTITYNPNIVVASDDSENTIVIPAITDIEKDVSWSESSTMKSYYGSRVGGIMGQGYHIILEEAYNSGAIKARFGVGGLVGTMISENDRTKTDNTITTGFNIGTIIATSGLATTYNYGVGNNIITTIQINAYVGGIVGRINGASTLSNSMNVGNVSATWEGIYENSFSYNDMTNVVFTHEDQISEESDSSLTESHSIGARGAGGIVGQTSIERTDQGWKGGNKDLRNVINTGTIEAWSYVGGIAGIFAYSELSYAMNVGSVIANGELLFDGNEYAFAGALVGLGVAANLTSTSVFDGDIFYSGYTDSIIQAIGNANAVETLGYEANTNSSIKLSSSHLICQTNNQKPFGLNSTFFESGWSWNSYDEDAYYYYPQLQTFVNETLRLNGDEIRNLSKIAVQLSNIDNGPVTDTHSVRIELNLANGIINDVNSIEINDNITFNFDNINNVWFANVNYVSSKDLALDLSNVVEHLSYPGYYFAGWYRDSAYNEEFDGYISSSDEILYAKWEPIEYRITLTGLQQYANGNVELDSSDNVIIYTINDTTNGGKNIQLPTIKENNAYEFKYWITTISGEKYYMTSFRIIAQTGGSYLLSFYDIIKESQQQVPLSNLMNLEFTLLCDTKKFDITYDYIFKDSEGQVIQNSSNITNPNSEQVVYTINSTFGLVSSTCTGYTFQYWYVLIDNREFEFITISDLITELTIDGLKDITIYGYFEVDSYELLINLYGGTFNNVTNGRYTIGEYTFERNEAGLWVTEIEYGQPINFVNNITISDISTPAGREFISFSLHSVDNVEIEDMLMPAYDVTIYAYYGITTYDIIIQTEQGTFNSSYANSDYNLSFDIEKNQLILKATYGSELTEALEHVKTLLVHNNPSLFESIYNFAGYNAVYYVGDNVKTFNYINVRLDNNATNPTITLKWRESSYTISVFDSVGNFITQYFTNDINVDWYSDNSIVVNKLKSDLRTILTSSSYNRPKGYQDKYDSFKITVNNELQYDGSGTGDEKIIVTGYTIISITLQPEAYQISFDPGSGATLDGNAEGHKLYYNTPIDTSLWPTATKSGYDFVGWLIDGNIVVDGTIYLPDLTGEDDSGSKTVTLTASYREKTYLIEFDISFTGNELWGQKPEKTAITYTFNSDSKSIDSEFFNFEGYEMKSPEITINNEYVLANAVDNVVTISVEFAVIKFYIIFDATEEGSFTFDEDDAEDGFYLENLADLDDSNKHIKLEVDAKEKTLRYYVVHAMYYSTANNYLPARPTKDGYTYSNFQCETTNIYIQTPLTQNTTFTAIYQKDKYNVTLTGETIVPVEIEGFYNDIIDLTRYTPEERENYTFSGWRVVGITDEIYTSTYTITSNAMLEAIWTPNEYQLTINVNDVDDSYKNAIMEAINEALNSNENKYLEWPSDNIFNIPYQTDISSLNNIEIENSILIYTKNTEGKEEKVIFSTMPAANISVKASIKTSGVIKITANLIYNNNTIYTLVYLAENTKDGYYVITDYVKPTLEMYDFTGDWYFSNDLTPISNITEHKFTVATTIFGNLTLKEEFSQFTITYQTYNEGQIVSDTILNVQYGTTIEDALAKIVSSRPGYTFSNWEINGNDVTNMVVTYNITGVVAKWNPVEYEIRYVTNGSSIKSATYEYQAHITNQPTIENINSIDETNKPYYNLNYYLNGTTTSWTTIFGDNLLMPNLGSLINDYGYCISQDGSKYIITIELVATPKEYTLHFVNSNVQTEIIADVTFGINSGNSIKIDVKEVSHYNFIGFGIGNDIIVNAQESYDFKTLIELFSSPNQTIQEVTLIYEPIKYTITFKFDEGYTEVYYFTINDQAIAAPNLKPDELEGFTFSGWLITENSKAYVDYLPVSELLNNVDDNNSITVTPKYEPKKYDVLFYNDGDVYFSVTVNYNTTFGDLYDMVSHSMSKQGYSFEGWYSIPNNIKLLANDSSNVITSTTIFVSKYNIDTYTIKFYGADNHLEKLLTLTINEFSNGNINLLKNYSHLGYYTKGWFIDGDSQNIITGINFATLEELSNNKILELYVSEDLIKYDITLDFNGGTYNNDSNPLPLNDKTVDDVINFKNDYESIKAGYILDHYEDASGNVISNMEDVAKYANLSSSNQEGEISLYAVYNPTKYTIIYSENGTTTETSEYDYDEFVVLEDSTLTGYEFVYWQDANGNKYQAGQRVISLTTEEKIQLTAYYRYDITFDGNGGNGEVSPISGLLTNTNSTDFNIVLPSNGFSKEHYIFLGWSTDRNADPNGGNYFLPGTIYSSLDKPLYAIWKPESYSVSYFDGDKLIDVDKYTYSQGLNLLADVTKTGYAFAGWYDNPTFEGDAINSISSGEFGNKQYYARFTKKQFATIIEINNVPSGYDFKSELLKQFANELEISLEDIDDDTNSISTTRNGENITVNITLVGSKLTIEVLTEYEGSREFINEVLSQDYSYSQGNEIIYSFKNIELQNADTTFVINEPLYSTFVKDILVTLQKQFGNNTPTEFAYIALSSGDILTLDMLEHYEQTIIGYSTPVWKYEENNYSDMVVSTPITLVLNYEPISFTIVYNDGTPSQSVTYGNSSTISSSGNNALGSQFIGWSLESDSKVINFMASDAVDLLVQYVNKQNIVNLYAVRRDYILTINFDKNNNDATGTMNSISYSYSDLNSTAQINFAIGYSLFGNEFTGWSCDELATIDKNSLLGLIGEGNRNITLKANWSPVEYNIKYVTNGGTYSDRTSYTINTNVTFIYDETSAIKPQREGYEFDGWYLNEEFTGEKIVSTAGLAKDLVLYAKWIENTYTISFVADDEGLYDNDLPESINITYGAIIPKLTTLDLPGYRFVGWFDESGKQVVFGSIYNYAFDLELKARFSPLSSEGYEVNFDMNGGDSISPLYNLSYGSEIILSSMPSRFGYNFSHFTINGSGVYVIKDNTIYISNTDETYKVTTNIVLKAEWTPISDVFKIKYHYDSEVILQTVTYGELVTLLSFEPIQGKLFKGWSNIEGGQVIYSNLDKVLINMESVSDPNDNVILELYSVFSEKTYTILFNLSGGISDDIDSITFTISQLPELPSKDSIYKIGYSFIGWFDKDDKEVSMVDVNIIKLANEQNIITLTAKWEANQYTISFVADDEGLYDSDLPESINITYGTTISNLTTLNLPGYTFVGWFDESGKQVVSGDIYTYTSDITIKPKFTKNIYNVELTINNIPMGLSNTIIGEISTNLKDYSYSVEYVENTNSIIVIIDVSYETNISFVDDLISDEEYTVGDIDYIFAGFDVSFDNTNMPSTDISAKGKFVTSEIRVLLYIDGIIAKTITPNLLTNGTYTLSESDLDTFTKTGYTLSKWYSDYNYNTEYNFGDTENTSKSLYAKWLPINYYVKFNANGGSGSMSNQTLTYDESNELTPNGFKYTGHTFIGWATTSNGDVVYTDHQMVINLSTKQDDVVNLYAIWSPNTYQIVFNGNGGTGNMPNQDIKYNETLELNAQQFSKIGYSFIGWAKTPNGPKDYDDCDEFTQNITNSVTLYALWKENEYTISFAVNNDEYKQTVSSIQIEYDKYISDIPTLTLAGYRFIGWYDVDGRQVINGMIYDYTSNITLTARWDNDTYNVTFDMAGGNQIPSQNVSYGGHIDVSNINPERLGYTFSHFTANGIEYYLSGEGKLLLADYEMTSSNITFTAVWNANTYNIRYELDGGSITLGTNPTTFEYGKISLTALLNGLKKPEKEGYTFTNWSVDVTSLPASDLIITAEYSINRYLVEFDTAGGNYINPIYVEYKGLIPTQIVSKTGYDFSHFTYEGKKVDLSTFLMPANNIILVAAYDRLEYQVTFNYMYNDLMGTLGYNVEENKVLETPSRNGYSFGGWYLNEEYTGEAIISTAGYAENLELYAKWNKNTYQITYVLNDDIENNNPNSYDVENIVEFANPMRAGYVFDGWYLDADYKNQITDTTGRIGNLVLHAKWVLEDEYTITYANVDNYDGITSYTVESNVVFKNPTKTGYKFVGWDYEGTYITSTNGLVGDITVTAVWEIITYNINYDLDEGTLTSKNPSTYNVETATITLNEPEKLGYKFLGWYNGQTKVETIKQGSTGDISLVAKWEVITYTITYDLNDGTNNRANKDSYSVVANITFASPTREGYTFVNWTYNGQEITSTDERFENLVLVANWEVTNYSIVYNLDGGTNSSENPTSYNVEKVVGFKEPTKTGYTFVAWYLDSDYTIEIGDTTGYAKDLVLYAKWEINSYKVSFLTGELGINVPEITMNYYETYGSKLPVLEMPYGISFVTWYYETTDGEVVNVTKDSIFNLTTDITLKAQYTTTAFNIVYETNGGINHSSNVTTVTALAMAEKPLVLLAPSKTGYSFVGWYLDSSFGGEAVVEISPAILANSTNGILTLYAKYEVSRYTITYQDIDGTVIKTVNNVAYNSLAELFTPTKDGYIFDAWYLNGAKYDFNTPVTGNLTLVAMYRIMEVSTETVMNNETVKVVVTSVDGKGLPADAHIVIELVVEEESNNQVADLLQEYGQVSRFYDIKLVDAKGNEIAPSSEVRVTLSLPNEEITVDKTYSIVNIKDDLSDWQEIESYLKDGNLEFFTTHFSYYAIVVTDKAIDFTWLWIVLGVAGFLLVQVIIIVIIKTRRFKIRFVSKGNVKVKEIKYRKNMSVTLPTPSRIGYKFVGWYLDQEFKYPANIKTMPNENLILYARWIEDPLTIGLKVKKAK